MKSVWVVGFILVSLVVKSECDSKLRLCHGIECPHESVSCTKSFKSSPDNKQMITSYICDGANGEELDSKTVVEANRQWQTKVHQPYTITKEFLVI